MIIVNSKRVFLSVVIAFLMDITYAFSYCPSYPDVEQEFQKSDFVFVGKVLSEEKVNATQDGFFDGINYKLAVIEPLKGHPDKIVTTFSENSSGRFPMRINRSYLVFTVHTESTFAGVPVFTINYCGNSGEVSKKKKALLLSRKLNRSSTKKSQQAEDLGESSSFAGVNLDKSSEINPSEGCKNNSKLVDACFTVHGRISVYNGTPGIRLWPVGTKRLIGIIPSENEIMPDTVKKALTADDYNFGFVFGDFLVCPFTKSKEGQMQFACIESASNLRIMKQKRSK